MRGATLISARISTTARNFNPRTPCGVRRSQTPRSLRPDNFNPRTPCGVRLRSNDYLRQPLSHFNPRTPCGVRHTHRLSLWPPPCISIHAPRAGCDSPSVSRRNSHARFQSTHPVRGATRGGWCKRGGRYISIHAPRAGCDNRPHGVFWCWQNFNPRAPCGVRPACRPCGRGVSGISIHAPRAGCDENV